MEQNHLIVTLVDEGSQAQNLGIKIGDIIISYNGTLVSSISEFSDAVSAANENGVENREILISRGDQKKTFNASKEMLGFTYRAKSSDENTSNSSYNVNNETVNSGELVIPLFSGFLMLILGVIASLYLFLNAKSGWSGLDSRMVIGGCVILVYQVIISYLCFKVADLTKKVAKFENQK